MVARANEAFGDSKLIYIVKFLSKNSIVYILRTQWPSILNKNLLIEDLLIEAYDAWTFINKIFS